MGKRGEIFSSKLVRDRRTYFFNVHENFGNSLSLSIIESKKNESDDKVFHRQSVLVFQEDLNEFLREMQKAVDIIRKKDMSVSFNDRDNVAKHEIGKEVKIIKASNKEKTGKVQKKPIKVNVNLKGKKIVVRKKEDE